MSEKEEEKEVERKNPDSAEINEAVSGKWVFFLNQYIKSFLISTIELRQGGFISYKIEFWVAKNCLNFLNFL